MTYTFGEKFGTGPEFQVASRKCSTLDLGLPVPVITLAAKRARQQIAGVLSSDQCIIKQPKTKEAKKQKKVPSSSKSEEVVLNNSEEERLSDYENECVGCGEDFRKTKKKDDWI
ncbi:hypothetical protein ILUMI_22993 [Ignelater luminosus]|uniref:Uncharacterized protein n=1 Tax=Ignelater luminosus TaxID=2038154 RepID=A0A8K0CCT7_IGNLU|nr:hypothetical protein ILUMI_22993 [Ignelater luminosus]